MITKVRANYLSYISKLSNLLGKTINPEEDDEDLEDLNSYILEYWKLIQNGDILVGED